MQGAVSCHCWLRGLQLPAWYVGCVTRSFSSLSLLPSLFPCIAISLFVLVHQTLLCPLPPSGQTLAPFLCEGILKKTDCLSKKAPEESVDLYVIETTPQPPPAPPASNFPPIWPSPKAFTNGSSVVTVDAANFKLLGDVPKSVATRFLQIAENMFSHTVGPSTAVASAGAITGATIAVADPSAVLQLGVAESYTLSIPTTGNNIAITAQTVFGAYHALETLSQLVTFNFDAGSYEVAAAPWKITDEPRFAHREVLMDSARHFEPVETIKSLIDSLTYAKVNVVHWHLVDSQSFPFDSATYPLLSKMGAYSNFERYSVADVEDVVAYGNARGVRIMVEFDVPGHAQSWCKGHPEICPSASCTTPLNPATNKTFDLLAGLFRDVTGGTRGNGLFPDNMMHLGGDEVNTGCYSSTPSIAAWLKERGLTPDQGYAYFVKRAHSIARAQGRDVAAWEEVWDHFGTELDKSTIIHQWLPGSKIAANATSHGYRVLWSTDGVWYLDGLGTTWETMYTQEPCNGIPDEQCNTLMLGGGGAMWGETVDTSDIMQTVWPRMGAIAERLWSPRELTSTDAAVERYKSFRCLLNRRGIAAAPALNANARSSPPGPGSCYAQ